MAHRPLTMARVFLIVVGIAGFAFAHLPDHADAAGGSGLLHRVCAACRRARRSRAYARSRATINAMLKDDQGIKGWVTIGGYSALDTAKLSNVITVFVIYDDWDKRPPGFTQAGYDR